MSGKVLIIFCGHSIESRKTRKESPNFESLAPLCDLGPVTPVRILSVIELR